MGVSLVSGGMWRGRWRSRAGGGLVGVGRRAVWALALALFAAALPACEAAFNNHRAALGAMHADGRYDLIARSLDEPDNRALYGEKNELLWMLDRGSAALALGDADTAIAEFSAAEQRMEERRSERLDESAAVLLMNDTHKPYLGEPYEDMYVNVFKMLAQLEAGRVSGGATVEARRMALKADLLRDEYLRLAPKTIEAARSEQGGRPSGGGGSGAGVGSWNADSGGKFVESPLGLVLSAVAFMHDDATSDQEVALRRLGQIAQAQRGQIGPVDVAAFEGLESWRRPGLGSGKGHILVVALSGRGPRKESSRQREGTLFVDLPVLRWRPSEAQGARCVIDGASPEPLDLAEDLSRVASVNFDEQLPIIRARAYARAAAKAAGVAAATWGASTTNNDAATLAVLLGGMALLIASEQADLRGWECLPGQAHVRLLEVPSGRRDVTVEWEGRGGGTLYSSGRRTIDVPEGGLATVVEYWWR